MNFHNKSKEEIINSLKVDLKTGLTSEQVKEKQKENGYNEFTPQTPPTFLEKLIDSVKDPMLLILMAAAGISIGNNILNYMHGSEVDISSSVGIFFAIALSATISIVMEGKSSKAFAALNKIGTNILIEVLRNNKITKVEKRDITVGDIILLEKGNKIAADGRLIESDNLRVDESMLTGETTPSKKNHDTVCDEEVILAERINMVYSGTNVTEGRGRMIVTSIGDNTEMGKIADKLKGMDDDETPLQEKLASLGKTITVVSSIISGLVFLISIYRMYVGGTMNFNAIQESFSTSIALIVAAVPEGLPTMIAITLALNMKKMASLNALVKKLDACETIGAINVICSDKTGTLTENKMSVRELWSNGDFVDPLLVKEEDDLIINFALNGTANLEVKDGKSEFIGNPTECALLSCINKNTNLLDYDKIRDKYHTVHQYAFSSSRKMMSTVIEKGDIHVIYTKGAPEKILDLSTKVLVNGQIVELTEESKAQINNEIEQLQSKARRVIGFGYKNVGGNYEYENENIENDFIFLGFVGIADPLRADVYGAIEKCTMAGIDFKMLTGDNIVTATAIATELGVVKEDSLILEAKDIEKMSDEQLIEKLPRIVVIARSTPETKERVVCLLKKIGHAVAVTGDGINDAPALKKADVGIAMGISGTEVSKESAKIVLLDDAFSTIVNSVKFGRGIYENFQRFITFQLTVNVAAFAIAISSELFGFKMPFTTLQLLWVNIIMDGPPALTLGLEKVRDHVMSKKPVPRDENIITRDMWLRIVSNGLCMLVMLLGLQIVNPFHIADEQMTTVMFTSFIFLQLFNAFNSREFNTDSIIPNFFTNKYLLIAFGVCTLVQVIVVQFGSSVFKTVPLDFITWLEIIGYSFFIIIFSEIVRLMRRLLGK